MSPPSQLTSLQTFDIAVKQSNHPPAHWVHTQVLIWLQPQVCTIVIASQAWQRQYCVLLSTGSEVMASLCRQYGECR